MSVCVSLFIKCVCLVCIGLWIGFELAWSKSADGKLRPRDTFHCLMDRRSHPVMLPNFSQKEEGLHICSEEINHRVRGQRSLVYKALWPVSDSYFSWMEKQEIENCAYSLSYVLSLSEFNFLVTFNPQTLLSQHFYYLFFPILFLFTVCSSILFTSSSHVITVLFVSVSSSSFSRNLLLVTLCLLTNFCLLEEMLN